MPAEFDYINWIKSQQKPHDRVTLGIGDDLAILNWKSEDLLLVGVDQVLDGVHFDSTIHSPRSIGQKAMNRNLSDCAAMGCLPAAAVVTVALPKGVGENYAKELFLGMKQAGELFDAPIVGGDTSTWTGKLVLTVTILGRSDGVTPITRADAKPGDSIYVTGPLGGSILGRHMTFEPRVNLARQLVTHFKIHAMADLSDGLMRDLRNICQESRVGAGLILKAVPIHPDVYQLPGTTGADVHALTDGEDYELLIVSPDVLPPPCILVGHIEQKNELSIHNGTSEVTLPWDQAGGWDHTF